MTPERCNIWRSWSYQFYLALKVDADLAARWKARRTAHMTRCPICQAEPVEPAEHDYTELDKESEETK